mgnify:CR=1 FL=1
MQWHADEEKKRQRDKKRMEKKFAEAKEEIEDLSAEFQREREQLGERLLLRRAKPTLVVVEPAVVVVEARLGNLRRLLRPGGNPRRRPAGTRTNRKRGRGRRRKKKRRRRSPRARSLPEGGRGSPIGMD